MTSPDKGPRPGWVAPLLATLVIQAASAFLTRLVPTIGPALKAEVGLSESSIGYLAAATTVGSILFLVAGSAVIWRLGPIRSLQVGLALGIVGLAILAVPFWPAALLASLLIGLGYGPSSPAGSDVLQRYAPARHRNLIFSVKQAGVPLGGVVAGLCLPPVVEAFGWRASLGVSALGVLLTLLLVQPLRDRIDVDRHPGGSLSLRTLLSPTNLLRPLRPLKGNGALWRLALVGSCLAFAQGCWFAFLVTYLVGGLGYSLTAAGAIFGVMQGAGIFGRVALGWISDRLGSGRLTLQIVALTSAATSALAAVSSSDWPVSAVLALCGVAGITVSSWNGVQVAEIARLAPKGLVGETAAGATIVLFTGFVIGPTLFGALLAASAGFGAAFAVVALVSAAPLAMLAGQTDRPASP